MQSTPCMHDACADVPFAAVQAGDTVSINVMLVLQTQHLWKGPGLRSSLLELVNQVSSLPGLLRSLTSSPAPVVPNASYKLLPCFGCTSSFCPQTFPCCHLGDSAITAKLSSYIYIHTYIAYSRTCFASCCWELAPTVNLQGLIISPYSWRINHIHRIGILSINKARHRPALSSLFCTRADTKDSVHLS